MNCPHCMTPVQPGVRFCASCGGAVGAAPPPGPAGYAPGPGMPPLGGPEPKYNLVLGILTTLFCCLIGGIISIVYGTQVSSKWSAGDYQGAQSALNTANQWMMWSAIIGGILQVIIVGANIAIAVAAASHG